MGKKVVVPIISFIVFIIIVYIYVIGCSKASEGNHIVVENGVIDLRAYDIAVESKPINLDGVWEFYPNQFTKNFSKENEFVPFYVPDNWKGRISSDKKSAFGYGTFHLKILMNPKQESQLLGLKVNDIKVAHRIFVNGKEISKDGIVGKDITDYEPKSKSYSVFFQNNEPVLDLAIWVSNYHSVKLGGIIKPVYFGTQSQILAVQEDYILIETIIISMVFIIAATLLGGFFINRNLNFLYCGLYGFSSIVLFSTNGEDLLYRIMPYLSYLDFQRIHSIAILTCILFFIVYMVSIMPPVYNKYIVGTIETSVAILAVLCLYFSTYTINLISYYASFGCMFILFYILQGIVFTAFRRNSETVLYAMSLFSVLLGLISYSPHFYFAGYYNYYVIIFAAFQFILARAFLTIKRQKVDHQLVELMTEELNQVNTLREELIIKTSREFKSQFLMMCSFLKLILEDEKDRISFESLHKLKFLMDSLERLSRVTTTINDIVKVDDGENEKSSKEVEIKNLLEGIVNVYGFIYSEVKCNIYLKVPDQNVFVKGDSDKLIYIILSIFDSALLNLYAGDINIILVPKINCIELVVSTSGNDTLSPDIKQALDEQFISMNDAFPYSFSEMGLGLTKKLVDGLGGSIKCYSNRNFKKTCLYLPLAAIKESTTVDSSENNCNQKIGREIDINFTQNNQNGSQTILIIDDDKDNLNFLFHVLSRENYHIVLQSLSDEALNIKNNYSQIDLVIINLVITNALSFDRCKMIREQFSMIELPILILTSPVSEKFIHLALNAGANDIIQKPIHPDELKARIVSLLNIKSLSESKQSYEMAFLNAQIKPHFLFNALNSLVNLCETDPVRASDLVIAIANFLRGTLNFSNTDKLIPLEKEIAITKAYLGIEASRFNNLAINYDMDNTDGFFIPPLSIQILAENVIKHVIKSSTKQYMITISIKKKKDNILKIKIEDNGEGLSEETIANLLKKPVKDGSIGIYNVNTRLKTFCDSNLEYITSGNGTSVVFYIRG
ncbi:histidine kinase [Aminipila terrae]|uniref:Stage 0 sporulation protein A homolog n=2 Tax=Aminipila terrae TaxID=2697030 RepID=A0A6P1MAH1_9FIRM|nr:histidine kinase [Aminipila terrae]QHI71620.1 response regulator [Aminipila terrae]